MTKSKTDSYQLKTLFDTAVIEDIAGRLHSAYAPFDRTAFARDAGEGLDALELKQRSQNICAAMIRHLPSDFAEATSILLQAMGQDDGSGGLEGFTGFRFMPFLDYVAEQGHESPEIALDVLEQMTLFFSAEFAIRPYILADPERTLARMLAWAEAKDWRVRRLASEGSRPRLPWAPRLPLLIKDPSPVLPILDRLHNDPHLVVRRSVANHLNDIAKDHPDFAAATARRWWASGDEDSRWTVQHGLRTLVKQGHPEALEVLGFRGGADIELEDFVLEPGTVEIGSSLEFSFSLISRENEEVRLAIDYALHRVLKNGKKGRKVFKLTVTELAPGESQSFTKRQAFRQLSTRTYYPGTHRIEILANGRVVGGADFAVLAEGSVS